MTRYSVGVVALVLLGAASIGMAERAAAADDTTAKVIEYYRRKANIPPATPVEFSELKASPIKGAKSGVISAGGRKMSVTMSDDGRYVVFGEVEDITVDPFKAVMEKIVIKDRPMKGSKDAKVTIVEYSDFQCPFCTRGYTTMENQVLKEYGNKVKFFYKHFPLPMHPWAQPAAVATECALQQGKPDAYWKLYDYYFQNQKDITVQNIKEKSLEVLKGTGVDEAKFTDCYDNNKTLDAVKAQMAEGQSVGVTGTPGFIINGRLVSGAQPFENFKAIIDDELARANGSKK
jgi:protein-disulfide isomerase